MLKTETSELNLMIEGDANSEIVILLHGGPGVPDYLSKISSLLNESYKVVRFDQRGTGASKCLNGNYEIEEYLYDIDQIIAFLQVDKVHLFGHSWGGLLAQIYASKHPETVKSLFLSSPSSGTGDVWKEMEKEVMAYNKNKSSSAEWLYIGINSLFGITGFDRCYRNIFALIWKNYFKTPSEAPEADKSWLSGIKADAFNKTIKSVISFDNKILDKNLENFMAPVTTIFGSYDIYGASRESVNKRFPNMNYVTIEDSGHLPWIQNKHKFTLLLHDFYGTLQTKG